MSIPPDGSPAVTRTRVPADTDAVESRGRARAVAVAVVIGCAVVVTILAVLVARRFGLLLRLDNATSRAFYVGDHRSAVLNGVLHVVTAPGLAVARLGLAVPLLAWLLWRRAWWTAAWVAIAYGLISPITSLGKDVVGRLRPPFANGGALNASPSFPSGHSSGIATTVVVGLILAWPFLGAAARRVWLALGVAGVVVVGLSRMWLGLHYLSDVVAGWALGVGWALLLALVLGALPGGRAALRPRS